MRVEISRGCGLGCSFCTIGRVPVVHLPPQTILADVETNVAGGMPNIALLSEDFFRYGANGVKADPNTLLALVRSIRRIPQVRLIQIDHASVASVAQYDDSQLQAIHDLLVGQNAQRYVWVNVGVETASDELLKQIGAAAKCKRSESEPWGDFCRRQLRRLCQARYFPMASLVIGLPGERDEHLQDTLAWVESLADQRLAVFPVLYAPVDGSPPLNPGRLRPLHWALIRACYRLNFRWVPWFHRDNQAAAGVPFARRMALQLLGYGQILQWQSLLAWHQWRARETCGSST
ncbi:MAG: radical SAM protein [Planctomycetota bacterium]|nr:radical SAM protein [Planctomycetota bacterium]